MPHTYAGMLVVQDCNLVMYTSSYFTQGPNQNAIFATSTGGQGNGNLCTVQVSSANGGSFSVVNSNNAVLYLSSSVAQPAVVDTLYAGQSLGQGARLYSADGHYFLTVQSDGNAVS